MSYSILAVILPKVFTCVNLTESRLATTSVAVIHAAKPSNCAQICLKICPKKVLAHRLQKGWATVENNNKKHNQTSLKEI